MAMPHPEILNEPAAARSSQSERFDARPGVSRVELLAEFALGYRPDHGDNDPAEDVRHALTAYITVAEWECVVDHIAAEGRTPLDGELLRLSSIVSAQLEGCRQRRLTKEVGALGVDRDVLSAWVYEAVAEAYGKDSDIYDGEGYRRTEHLEAAARRKLIAKGYEANADHPAVEALVAEEIEHIFELSTQATYVAFQGGGNGEELAMARAHSELVRGATPSRRQQRSDRHIASGDKQAHAGREAEPSDAAAPVGYRPATPAHLATTRTQNQNQNHQPYRASSAPDWKWRRPDLVWRLVLPLASD